MAGKNALWRFAIGARLVPKTAERLAALATVRKREQRIMIMTGRVLGNSGEIGLTMSRYPCGLIYAEAGRWSKKIRH
jgi:hypothetical protein